MAESHPIVVSNPLFKLLVRLVAGLCAATLLVSVVLALAAPEPPTEMQKSLAELCRYGFMTTLGTLVGLLGGRAAAPDYEGVVPQKPPSLRKRT